jgi:hypothetical protein
MRKPTPHRDLWAWWRAAVAGHAPPIHAEPQCGFFRRKLVRGGPWVPVVIWTVQVLDAAGELAESERLRCSVNGLERDPEDEWGWVATGPITEKEFNYLCALGDWAEAHSPNDPAATPRQKIDFMTVPLPQFKKGTRS